MKRRELLRLAAVLGVAGTGLPGRSDDPRVAFGIAPVFLTELTSLLNDWRGYLDPRLGSSVVFVQRDTYREVTDSLLAGRLLFAWICGFPYAVNKDRLRLVAVPLYQGAPLYRSYLIAGAKDRSTHSLLDLEGRIFAYTDPDSNSGYLVPRVELVRQGIDPNRFFRRTFFAGGHRNAIEAVSVGLADGAHVDGYVWDTLERFGPEITRETRVVARSKSYAFPPIVAGPAVPESLLRQMREVLLAMGSDPAADGLLERLNLDGFVGGDPAAFEEIAAMALTARGIPRAP